MPKCNIEIILDIMAFLHAAVTILKVARALLADVTRYMLQKILNASMMGKRITLPRMTNQIATNIQALPKKLSRAIDTKRSR